MAKILYATATNITDIESINVTANHDSAVATALITSTAASLALTIGDYVEIDLGYSDSHSVVFQGYVKQIEKHVPSATYSITLYDSLIRAQDYFIASANPDAPMTRQNISAEDLVRDVIALCGLNTFSAQATSFTFGTANAFEINLVNALDYSKMICDLLTWSIWYENGTVYFKNRKPYVMLGTSGQPGDTADTSSGTIPYTNILNLSYGVTERNLRNRVVVYGTPGIYAEATQSSGALPAGFTKTAVLAAPEMVDNNTTAQDIADYNVNLLNRITETCSLSILGDSLKKARVVVALDSYLDSRYNLSLSGNWYVFACDHVWGRDGYTTQLELRRMVAW